MADLSRLWLYWLCLYWLCLYWLCIYWLCLYWLCLQWVAIYNYILYILQISLINLILNIQTLVQNNNSCLLKVYFDGFTQWQCLGISFHEWNQSQDIWLKFTVLQKCTFLFLISKLSFSSFTHIWLKPILLTLFIPFSLLATDDFNIILLSYLWLWGCFM